MPRLNAHNAAFDTRVLIEEGLLEPDHPDVHDTLTYMKNGVEGSCPLGLDFGSQRWIQQDDGRPYFTRLWKGDVDHKSGDTVQKDKDLWKYNGQDINTQMRMLAPLLEQVEKDGTRAQAEQDLRLMPIARNMGDLGLCISEAKRVEYAKTLRKDIREHRRKLRRIVGKKKFNPNSSRQVADWLYDEKGYTPQLNTAADPWEEGDPESAGIPALMALQDTIPKEADPELWDFVDLQIRYKSRVKLLTSYLDNQADLPVHPCGDEFRIIHPIFKLTIPSGRWASSPNVQNWPKRAVINLRTLAVAPPGHVFVCLDLDQAELRVLAEVAEDELDIRTILGGEDPHTMCSAGLVARNERDLHRAYERITAMRKSGDPEKVGWAEANRLVAKIFRFATSYGASESTMFAHMSTARNKATGDRMFEGYTLEQNRRNYDNFHRWHPNFRKWHSKVDAFVAKHGYAIDFLEFRKRMFPGGQASPNEGRNHEIQCTIGNVVNDMVEAIARDIPHRGWSEHSGLFIQVHDELGVCAPEERAEEAYQIMKRHMQRKLGVLSLTAAGTVSKIWTGPDLRKAA